MYFKFRGKVFNSTSDITQEILYEGIINGDLPNIDFMKASLLCFVENFRTFLNTPELEPSEYVIVNPFTECPADFPKIPKEERIVLIGWMAFFLKYIEHAVKKEYFSCEFVNELYFSMRPRVKWDHTFIGQVKMNEKEKEAGVVGGTGREEEELCETDGTIRRLIDSASFVR
ncbi:hypothetical protein ACTXT7_001489 [Hymenolepis weldensis]